jgi:hypothetical protein
MLLRTSAAASDLRRPVPVDRSFDSVGRHQTILNALDAGSVPGVRRLVQSVHGVRQFLRSKSAEVNAGAPRAPSARDQTAQQAQGRTSSLERCFTRPPSSSPSFKLTAITRRPSPGKRRTALAGCATLPDRHTAELFLPFSHRDDSPVAGLVHPNAASFAPGPNSRRNPDRACPAVPSWTAWCVSLGGAFTAAEPARSGSTIVQVVNFGIACTGVSLSRVGP